MQFFTIEVMRELLDHSLETAQLDGGKWKDVGKGPRSHEGHFIEWSTIRGQAQSVVADVARIKAHPLVPKHIPVYGYNYDVATGRLVEVGEATRIGQPRAAAQRSREPGLRTEGAESTSAAYR